MLRALPSKPLHLGKIKANLLFRSVCSNVEGFALEITLHLGKIKANLLFRSVCSNFAKIL